MGCCAADMEDQYPELRAWREEHETAMAAAKVAVAELEAVWQKLHEPEEMDGQAPSFRVTQCWTH